MKICLLQAPYDSGIRDQRMGRGPFHFRNSGALNRLKKYGLEVEEIVIESGESFDREIGTSFGLIRRIADKVRSVKAEGAFPLVLGGNCNSTLGALSGLTPRDMGLVWFDAHGDLNTPETSASGFLDGMGLSIITGRCWRTLRESIPGYRILADERVVLLGARDLDEAERNLLGESAIAWVKWEEVRTKGVGETMRPVVEDLAGKVDQVYVHIDMDVHDPLCAPANFLKPSGGLTPEEVHEVINNLAANFLICGASITAFDPSSDQDDKGLGAGLDLIEQIGELAAKQKRN